MIYFSRACLQRSVPYGAFLVVVYMAYLSFWSTSDVRLPEGLMGVWTLRDLHTEKKCRLSCVYEPREECISSFHAEEVDVEIMLVHFVYSSHSGWLAVEPVNEDMWITFSYFNGVLNVTTMSHLEMVHFQLGKEEKSGVLNPSISLLWRRKWKYLFGIFLVTGICKWIQKRLAKACGGIVSLMQTAKKREACYESRDLFHKCLDTLPEDQEKECASQKKAMEKTCPASWISYFAKQREREVILQLQVEQHNGRKGE